MFLILEDLGCLVDCARIKVIYVNTQPVGLQSELHFHLKGGNRPERSSSTIMAMHN